MKHGVLYNELIRLLGQNSDFHVFLHLECFDDDDEMTAARTLMTNLTGCHLFKCWYINMAYLSNCGKCANVLVDNVEK